MKPVELLDRVDAYYQAAFGNLITLTLVVLGFGGVVLPLVLQTIQNRSFRIEQESLLAKLRADTVKMKEDLAHDLHQQFLNEKMVIESQLRTELRALERKIDTSASKANGRVFFLQAISKYGDNEYSDAMEDYASAAYLCLKGEDDLNGLRAIAMVKTCMKEVKAADLVAKPSIREKIVDLLELLHDEDSTGKYSDTVGEIGMWLSSVNAPWSAKDANGKRTP